MRRISGFLFVPLVLVAAMALPATTFAGGGYSTTAVINYCDGADAVLKMKNKAFGDTPANRLTTESWAQLKRPSGWQNVRTYPTAVSTFPSDGTNHTLTVRRTYTGTGEYYFRVVFRLRAWAGSELVSSSTFKGVRCPVAEPG